MLNQVFDVMFPALDTFLETYLVLDSLNSLHWENSAAVQMVQYIRESMKEYR